jgi:hypothetical protein
MTIGSRPDQGRCPPLSVLRRRGVRTRREIEAERCALKALRGDFPAAARRAARPHHALYERVALAWLVQLARRVSLGASQATGEASIGIACVPALARKK